MSTAVTKVKVFALTAAFSVIKNAVAQVTKYNPDKDDTIVFNALTRSLSKSKKGEQK